MLLRNKVIQAVALLISALLCVALMEPAKATWTNYQTSPSHIGIPSHISADYDVMQMHFGTNDSDPSNYYFYLNFVMPVRSNMYADGLGSYAEIRLDLNLDGNFEYAMRTDPKTAYEGTQIHPARLIDLTTTTAATTKSCSPGTFSDITSGASWIGFSIAKSCLPFGKKLGVMGRSVFDPSGQNEIDWVPSTEWKLDLEPIPSSAATEPTSVFKNLPTVDTRLVSLTPTPASHPANLVQLSARMAKSVVTIVCGGGLGSGWSAQATLDKVMQGAGYKSYIITNYHVIRDCTVSKNVKVTIAGGTPIAGVVWAWDQANDVAAVAVKNELPALVWAGQKPQTGWWVGVEGSPLGYAGVLSEGVVSSVASQGYLATTSAHINPGNSGGPAFDRMGRVIGISTAKYVDTEGLGILHGTPVLCVKIFLCTSADSVWKVGDSAEATPSPTPSPTETADQTLQSLHDASQMLLQGALTVLAHSIGDLNTAIKQFPKSASTLRAVLKLAPKQPVAFQRLNDEINAVSGFVKAVSDFEKLVNAKVASIHSASAKG